MKPGAYGLPLNAHVGSLDTARHLWSRYWVNLTGSSGFTQGLVLLPDLSSVNGPGSFRPWVVSPWLVSPLFGGSFRPCFFLLKHQGLSQAMFGDIYGGLDFPTIIFRWVRVGGGGGSPDSYWRKPLTHEERAPFHSPATRRHMSRHTR